MILLAASLAAGCGKKGPPLPPLGKRPPAPSEVELTQRGSELWLELDLPAFYIDGSPLAAPPSVLVVRSGSGRRGTVVRRFSPEEVPAAPGSRARLAVPVEAVFEGIDVERTHLMLIFQGGQGKPSEPSALLAVPREESPRPPSGLDVREEPAGVRLSWEPAADEAEYNVYRRVEGQPDWGDPRNPRPLGRTEFVDRDVAFGSDYEDRIRTVVADARPARESDPSPAAQVARRDRFPPAMPTEVRAVAGPDGIRLFWFPPTDPDLAGYRVYRRTDEGGEPARLAELPADLPFLLDGDVTPGVRYTYTVTAVDDASPPNESPHSESAADRMPAAGPGTAPGPKVDG